MILVIGLWTFLRALLCGSAAIALENTALRHQLAVLQHSASRPRLRRWDRILWVWLSRVPVKNSVYLSRLNLPHHLHH